MRHDHPLFACYISVFFAQKKGDERAIYNVNTISINNNSEIRFLDCNSILTTQRYRIRSAVFFPNIISCDRNRIPLYLKKNSIYYFFLIYLHRR